MSNKSFETRHYYNKILFSPWPFFIGISLFPIVSISIFLLNKYYYENLNNSMLILSIFLFIFIEAVTNWFIEITRESFYGKYTKKMRSALVFGFILFLLSEVMLFGAFFWAYFDRIFHLSYTTGFLSVPTSVELIRWFKEPLYATIILITSGYTCNYAYYMYRDNDLLKAYGYSILTNLLGFLFLYIQFLEYTHLKFTLTDTVYCSIFYVLTGFHGIHVIIGNIFLLIQYLIKFRYCNGNLLGLTLACIYWHFVDIIWIFLFIFVYLFNNLDYLLLKGEVNNWLLDTSFFNK